MIIIGEKINGAILSSAEAIQKKDAEFIKNLAVNQQNAGADYLDICAGSSPEEEFEVLSWLIETVQSVSDLPLCLDSPNPEILKQVMPMAKKEGIINSVSGEGNKCEVIYPLMKGNDWKVIALTCDNDGIPYDVDSKVKIAVDLIQKAAEYDITPDRILIDPLVMSLSTVETSVTDFIKVMERVREQYPTVKFTSGLSNISYGMPCRKIVNQVFLTMALEGGMDSALIDPCNKDTNATILAAEAALGKDKHCRKYNKAYRSGRIGTRK